MMTMWCVRRRRRAGRIFAFVGWLLVGETCIASLGVAQERHVVSGEVHSDLTSLNAALLARRVTVAFDRVPLQTAIDRLSAAGAVSVSYNRRVILGVSRSVTLHAQGLSLGDAFARILAETSLQLVSLPGGQFSIVAAAQVASVTGGVRGTVTNAATKQPLADVKVTVDGATSGVVTDKLGGFVCGGLTDGPHTIQFKALGFVRISRQVTVADGSSASLAIGLEPSALALDQVVVTGTVAPTELRAVPNAITIITARELEQRGIVRLDQLFHGDVPGIVAQNQGSSSTLDDVTMFSRGATALSASSGGVVSIGTTNTIKTYIDGVELANPNYLTQIDPKSIERIEILTGPQASTIYGSNAINGVMQIFTKRGISNAPQLTVNLLSGWVENNFSRALTPQHDDALQLSGVEGRSSYNVGGSWDYIGPWTPAKQTTRINGYGGWRLEFPRSSGKTTLDVTLRHTNVQTNGRASSQQVVTDYQASGYYTPVSALGLDAPRTFTNIGQTIGVTGTYAPTSHWSHEFEVGRDAEDIESRITARAYKSPSDTNLFLVQTNNQRRSMRYTMTASIPVSSSFTITATGGADAWQNLTSQLSLTSQSLSGTLGPVSGVKRQPGHNTGAFAQTQIGLYDRLFLTYGLRAEWNPNFGSAAVPSYAPRYGVAYTQEIGAVTAKVRASYGRATRPPTVAQKQAQLNTDSGLQDVYGVFNSIVSNPDLGPEYQQGGEGGVELYFSNRASFTLTRYNQTVDGLISAIAGADSVRSLIPNPILFGFLPASECISEVWGTSRCSSQDNAGYLYALVSQNMNVASIRNQGWEGQGNATVGAFTARGTYSWTKSRTIGVTEKYRSLFPAGVNTYAQFQPGASFKYLPEHTWALGVTYAQSRTSIGLNLSGVGRVTNTQDQTFVGSLSSSIRLVQNMANVSPSSSYINFNHPYVMTDLTATHRFTSAAEGVLQVQNLTNQYVNDYFAAFATMGQQTKAGVRVRL